jgi:hypothetical protein
MDLKKTLLQSIPLLLLLAAIPLGVNLLGKTTQFSSQASLDAVTFKVDGTNVVERNGQKVALTPNVVVELTSPIGPPAGTTATQSAQLSPKSNLSIFNKFIGQVHAQDATASCTNFTLNGFSPTNFSNDELGNDYIIEPSRFGTQNQIYASLSTTPTTTFNIVENSIVNPSSFAVTIPKNTGTTPLSYSHTQLTVLLTLPIPQVLQLQQPDVRKSLSQSILL